MKKLISILSLCLVLTSCKSYYQETGIAITTGDVTAPIEVSDSSDIVTVRMLFSMTGARVWASKGYSVSMKYMSAETNDYFGVVTTNQRVDADISASCTNTYGVCTKHLDKE